MDISDKEIERNKHLTALYPEPTKASYSSYEKPKIEHPHDAVEHTVISSLDPRKKQIIAASALLPIIWVLADTVVTSIAYLGTGKDVITQMTTRIGMLFALAICLALLVAVYVYFREKINLGFGVSRTVFALSLGFIVPVVGITRTCLITLTSTLLPWWAVGIYLVISVGFYVLVIAALLKLLLQQNPQLHMAVFITVLPYVGGLIVAISDMVVRI